MECVVLIPFPGSVTPLCFIHSNKLLNKFASDFRQLEAMGAVPNFLHSDWKQIIWCERAIIINAARRGTWMKEATEPCFSGSRTNNHKKLQPNVASISGFCPPPPPKISKVPRYYTDNSPFPLLPN